MTKPIFLNRNEVIQGPSPECLKVLKDFDPKHLSSYFDGYYGSLLIPKISNIFGVLEEQILVGYGAEYFLRIIIDSLNSEKDSALTSELHYSFYDKYLAFKGIRLGQFKMVEKGNSFEFDIEDCLGKINTLDPKVILIASPNNPTGNRIALTDLVKVLKASHKDSLVVLDEAYCGFDDNYDEKEFISLINQYDNLLILRSFSKLYALAGARIGFALCGKKVKEILGYQGLYLGGSRILEELAVAALGSKEYYSNLSREIIENRTSFIEAVNSLNYFRAYDSRANFVLVKVGFEAKALLESKLETAEFLISKFINSEFMRVTIGSDMYTTKFLEFLKEVDQEA